MCAVHIRRVPERRQQADRRMQLHRYPHGRDRRYKLGRRKDDKWDMMKAMLLRLFAPEGDLGSMARRRTKRT